LPRWRRSMPLTSPCRGWWSCWSRGRVSTYKNIYKKIPKAL
jgi:hypothetical protein